MQQDITQRSAEALGRSPLPRWGARATVEGFSDQRGAATGGVGSGRKRLGGVSMDHHISSWILLHILIISYIVYIYCMPYVSHIYLYMYMHISIQPFHEKDTHFWKSNLRNSLLVIKRSWLDNPLWVGMICHHVCWGMLRVSIGACADMMGTPTKASLTDHTWSYSARNRSLMGTRYSDSEGFLRFFPMNLCIDYLRRCAFHAKFIDQSLGLLDVPSDLWAPMPKYRMSKSN